MIGILLSGCSANSLEIHSEELHTIRDVFRFFLFIFLRRGIPSGELAN